jgi:hypothetical protein
MGGARTKRKKQEDPSAAFARRLVERLSTREGKRKDVYVLDLRGKEWDRIRPGKSGFLTVRNRQDEGWPDRGRTTSDAAVAEEWVRTYYAPWLERRARIVEEGPNSDFTVAEAVDAYLQHLEKTLGTGHNTLTNRRSTFNVHVIPAFGQKPLLALTKAEVRTFLNDLKVVPRGTGDSTPVPAEHRTKDNVRSALLALWHHTYEDEPAPFAGIKLKKPETQLARRAAAEAGDIEGLVSRTSYTPDEILDLLAHAMLYDEDILGRPNLACTYFPNTAAAFALAIACAARNEEETFIRWKHIYPREEAILLIGTKTTSAPRWMPLQRSVRPWLRMLRAQQGGLPSPDTFVLQTRRGQPTTRSSKKTWGARIATVEKRAGLKLPHKATHILRATHMSLAKDRISDAALKEYVGHSTARGGATDIYMDLRPPFIPKKHRNYIRLPSPDEVRVRAEQLRMERQAGERRPARRT